MTDFTIDELSKLREDLRLTKIGKSFTVTKVVEGKKKRIKYELVGMDQFVDLKKFPQMWFIRKPDNPNSLYSVTTSWFIKRDAKFEE